jgi:hypothetical protein
VKTEFWKGRVGHTLDPAFSFQKRAARRSDKQSFGPDKNFRSRENFSGGTNLLNISAGYNRTGARRGGRRGGKAQAALFYFGF